MSRETWAVYSVRDHKQPYAFVADVLLYDRLRIPTASPDDWDRWIRKQWQPDRQSSFVRALGNRAKPLEWNADQRERWSTTYEAAKASADQTVPDAFTWTRMQLIESLPRSVTGVDTVAAYSDLDALKRDTGFQRLKISTPGPGIVSAALAQQFAVPAELDRSPADIHQEIDVLNKALAISSTREYRRNRRAYWRWLREFTDGVVTDLEPVHEAACELADLMDEQRQLLRDARIDTTVRTGFLVAGITLGMVGAAALSPVVVAGAALSVGHFTWTELHTRRQLAPDRDSRVAAMFCQIDDEIRSQYFDTA